MKQSNKDFFDKICDKNFLGPLTVRVGDNDELTKYKGMEDGLAIAKACKADSKLKFKLLDRDKKNWNVDYKKYLEHSKKIVRKDIVLNQFIGMKGYSLDALRDANISSN